MPAINPVAMWRVLIALCLGFTLAAAAASAAPVSRVATQNAETLVYLDRSGFAPGDTAWIVFEQKLRPGWHVYWKNPGDSGLPLDLQWSVPEGFEVGEVVYPIPERIPVGPFANFGHHGAPVFLVPITAPPTAALGASVDLSLRATWLICEDVCIPEDGEFSLTLPVEVSPAPDPGAQSKIEAARAAAPQPYAAGAEFWVDGGTVTLQVADLPAAGELFFFPEQEALIEPSRAQAVAKQDGAVRIEMVGGFAAGQAGDVMRGVLRLDTPGERVVGYDLAARRVEARAAWTAGAEPPMAALGQAFASGAVWPLLAAAFFGGILLNAMPCVFPVIFIKAASLMKAAGADRTVIRRDGWLYTAGVVASFALLGGLLLLLRAGGAQLGWGFHLQSPAIVLLSAYILFMVGLNLAGVFHVGVSLQGAGDALASKGGAAGAFFTGVLAVVVAAPCIGPLLAAPVGAAVMLAPATGMTIFLLMGLGLAAPYLALTLVPALGRRLPRPGAWMTVFKQALAFPVFAAAAYFLWVLAQQTGAGGLGAALGGIVLLALAAWLFELSKNSARRRSLALRVFSLAAIVMALAPTPGLEIASAAAVPSQSAYGGLDPLPFDEERIAALRAEGTGVFVDFTAAWCVTCQVNKVAVLSRDTVAAAFAREGAAFMVADWTRRDPMITQALARFGANGVPLYVYYPPGDDKAEILPLPLTESAVIRAIKTQ